MKKLTCILLSATIFMACNSPEQNTATGNTADSTTIMSDSSGDARGEKGAGVDNSGGTPGTVTDTAHGKPDTLDHTSKKGKK